MIDWKGFARKLTQPRLRSYPEYIEGLRKTTMILRVPVLG
jgi:hypothetical protein